MKATRWATGLAIAATCAIGVAAQTPSTSGTTSEKTITVVGCLENASTSASGSTATGSSTTGTTGSSGMTSGSSQFVLANAMPSTGTSTGTTGATGSTSTASGTSGTSSSSTTTGSRYMLEGQTSELQPHTGHQIEVTGTLDTTSGSTSSGATGTTGTTGSETSSGGSSSMANAQRLKVSSVRMISATCPAK
jgi:hypothetical protein